MLDSSFDVSNNPNLNCIEVDDAIWSATNWNYIDPQSFFDENCIALPSDNFAIEIISETCPGKNNGQVSISANETYDYETTINSADYNFIAATKLKLQNIIIIKV
jgi:hypothetical protein